MSDTERLGKQSASTAYRRRRCSGSVNLIRELRAAGKLTETPPSPDAQSGTRVHAAWSLSQVSMPSWGVSLSQVAKPKLSSD